MRLSPLPAAVVVILLMLSPTPGSAAVTNLLYGTQASTIQSPAVSLVSGSAGSSTISSVAPIAATVTATAGLTFYESANAPTVAPAVDGFARTGMPDLVQSTFKACASGTSCSQTFTSNVLSKDIVVVSIEWVGAVTAIAISDGQASARCSFTAVSGSPVSHTSETAMWYCTTTTAGPMTPTVSWTTARVSKLDIYEIVGYATAGLTCNTGTGSGSTSPAVASTAFSGTPFLVASYSMSTAVTVTAGAGFTRSDTSTAGDGGSGEYAAFGIASPTTFPATKSGTSAWAGIGCEFPESTLASVSLRLTTTGTSDLIYVAVCILNSGSQTVSAVTDSSSLSYSRRQFVALGTNVRIESWYATSTSALSADLITVSLSGAAEFVVVAMGVSGTNTASPFDPNLASPPTGTGTSATASTAITTAFPDDLIIGAVVAQSHPALTAGAGFTLVASRADASGTVSGGVEGQSVTTTQAGSTVSFTLGSSQNWAILADAVVAGQATPSADTSVSQPPSPGSFTIPVGSSAFLWSPAYSVPGTFYSGSWLLDLWASKATSSGTLTASIFLVSSNGAIAATVLSSGTTGSIPTSETEVKTTFAGSTAGIPAGGRVLVVLTNPSPVGATAATVYWGTSQLTNFQSPSTYSYVLTVSNGASASWTIGLATVGSMTSNLGRLTNLTVWLSSPTNVVTKEIVVTSGALTQASGATVTLAGSGTYSIGVAAYSAALPTSSNTPSTVTFSLRVKPTASTAFSQYTISLAVN